MVKRLPKKQTKKTWEVHQMMATKKLHIENQFGVLYTENPCMQSIWTLATKSSKIFISKIRFPSSTNLN